MTTRDPVTGRRPDYITITLMLIFHGLAIAALPMISTGGLIAFAILYSLTVLGITMGYHRYFTHHSFKTTRWVSYPLAVFGTLALQGGLRDWVAHHRLHHAGSDTDGDPHNAARGFWYSHLLWMFGTEPRFDAEEVRARLARDVDADPFLRFLSRPVVFISLQVILGILLWAAFGLEVMMWGIWVRLIAVYHVTWLVNSAAHLWGYQNFRTGDLSTNCWWVGLLAFGEGWHNNHHGIAESARHGLRWWEFDITWQVIRLGRLTGLIHGVKEAGLPDSADERIPVSVSPVSRDHVKITGSPSVSSLT